MLISHDLMKAGKGSLSIFAEKNTIPLNRAVPAFSVLVIVRLGLPWHVFFPKGAIKSAISLAILSKRAKKASGRYWT